MLNLLFNDFHLIILHLPKFIHSAARFDWQSVKENS